MVDTASTPPPTAVAVVDTSYHHQDEETLLHIPEAQIVTFNEDAVEGDQIDGPTELKPQRQKYYIIGGILLIAIIAIALICGFLIHDSNDDDSQGTVDASVIAMRLAPLSEYINEISLQDDAFIVAGGATPEDQALQWLIESDPQIWDLTNGEHQLHLRQRYALLTLWFQQDDDQEWYNTTGWIDDPNECHWYGIYCATINGTADTVVAINMTFFGEIEYTATQDNDEELNSKAYVTQGNNIHGTLSAELGLLQALEEFRMDSIIYIDFSVAGGPVLVTSPYVINNLTGSLPSSLSRCTNLMTFAMYDNDLTGTIPESYFEQWTRLQDFQASRNRLAGTISSSLCPSTTTRLESFVLDDNDLLGNIPDSIGNCSSLIYLNVKNNRLTGMLPESLVKLRTLTYLNVENNELTGNIPAELGNITSLMYLYVNRNRLNGTIPSSLDRLNGLTEGFFHDNMLSGTVPSGICDAPNAEWGPTVMIDCNTASGNESSPPCSCCQCA